MKTAVAFIIFNRPETTRRVFAEIARARPRKLFVIADAPRPDRAGEAELCGRARDVIRDIDWDCEVHTSYAQRNMGCRLRVSSGIDWVFSAVEEAIILEDDCLPHPDFFPFCEELLARYRADPRVMAIGGVNFQAGRAWGEASYYFSQYLHIWGWATWRRAWQHYDVAMRSFPDFVGDARNRFASKAERHHWLEIMRRTHDGLIDTWDYQWQLAVWRCRALTVVPNVNLVSNIGFGPEATHTKDGSHVCAALPLASLSRLCHPATVEAHPAADAREFRRIHRPGLAGRVRRHLARRLTRLRARAVVR